MAAAGASPTVVLGPGAALLAVALCVLLHSLLRALLRRRIVQVRAPTVHQCLSSPPPIGLRRILPPVH